MSRCTGRLLSFCMLVLAAFGWLMSSGAAQEFEANKTETPDVPALIKQLDADDFAARQEASQKLIAAGEAALPAVEKAVQSESREVATRAFDILKTHVDKGSPGLKEAAKQALERISKADLGSISRRATEILAPAKPAATPNAAAGGVFVPGGFRIAGARVAIAAGAIGGGVETKIKIEDGVKTTEVKDKDRKVKIVDDPAKGIQMEVTEAKDGKETTQKYEAKSADDLKTKHADAHKIYEQYNQKGAEIKIGGGAFGPAIPILPARLVPAIPAPLVPAAPPMRAVPVPFPGAPGIPIEIAPAPDTKKTLETIELLEKSLQEAEANLKELSKDLKDNEQLTKAKTRIEEARKQLEQLRSALK